MQKVDGFLAGFVEWNNLTERQRNSFFYGDAYLPLPEHHAARISMLQGLMAVEFTKQALYKVPNYSGAASNKFTQEDVLIIHSLVGEEGIAEVREWLFKKGVSFSKQVYLLYHELVVITDWKILINYWDAFAHFVGVAMVVVDNTKSWACEFHHDRVVTFMSY